MLDGERAIVHLDLDAFFASVEVAENPDLADKPVVIGGRRRGVVAAASYPARAFGIHSAMPMFRALQLCPQAVVVAPRHRLYSEYSHRVMEILYDASSQVQPMSIDEACLDLSDEIDEWEQAVDLAARLQRQVREQVNLSASVGVGTNKLIAKVASDHDKPGGLTVVRPGEEASFLAPLPVRVLWGIGPVTASHLAEMGVTTVEDLTQVPAETLQHRFGKHGQAMARQALGIDRRPVATSHGVKSISHERTFSYDLADLQSLKVQLWKMSQGVAKRMVRKELCAGTVAIKVRFADFKTVTRQLALETPTADEREIYRVGLYLLQRVWATGQPVRLLGIGGHDLEAPTGQLRLW
jgi:DNA polymerase IV